VVDLCFLIQETVSVILPVLPDWSAGTAQHLPEQKSIAFLIVHNRDVCVQNIG
jgi:hypothetical protein